ncbi:MAG: KTSC domain-containing protein [Flavobacteriaceae bacterium]|jgi:hypothetical protein|nr:KTSC domain-containing protein [Flavobacteriaceae bacterium]
MAITSEIISGTTILNEVQSSNIVRTQYDTITKKMIAEFKNGARYEYVDIPHEKYTQFRMAQSQGNYFNLNISKIHKYTKLI